MIAPCGPGVLSSSDESEAAAVEFALSSLNISSIIVCGHSECGAMKAIVNGRVHVQVPNLRSWLRHGEDALTLFKDEVITPQHMTLHNQASQRNVLLQIEHLKTYPIVQKALEEKRISIYGWWFDIARADVYAYEEEYKKFMIIDEAEAERILAKMG